MNILSLNSFKFNNSLNRMDEKRSFYVQSFPTFGLRMSQPLDKDTVSFGATEKMLKTRSNGINKKTAKIIHEEAKLIQEEIDRFVKGMFADMLVTPEKSNNIIEYISGRAKSPDSIVEKSETLGLNSKFAVFLNMTDLNGIKIVLRDGSKAATKKVLDRFQEAIEKGFIILTEVENKRPAEAKKLKGRDASKWDYGEPIHIDHFVDNAEKAMGKEVSYLPPDYTPANYSALHFLFRLPGQKRVFELQLMGRNVAIFKDFDDKIYKIINNKNAGVEYKPLTDALKPLIVTNEEKDLLKYIKLRDRIAAAKFTDNELTLLKNRFKQDKLVMYKNDTKAYREKVLALKLTEEDAELLRNEYKYIEDSQNKEKIAALKKKHQQYTTFLRYRAKAFLFQREKKPRAFNSNAKEYFLPLTDDLPDEYDLNRLYNIFLECKKKSGN